MESNCILVCGGRDFADRKRAFDVLDRYALGQTELIVHGGASGADALAQEWADDRGVCCMVYPADWKKHGRAAGPIRNQKMLDNHSPAFVLAFPGGRGTANMRLLAAKAGIPIVNA